MPSAHKQAGAVPAQIYDYAPGRLPGLKPYAVVDIGSNSVRLVIYEGLSRSPTPIFNEKELCGLGRSVASTKRLDDEAMEGALTTLRRFKALCDQMHVSHVHVIATAAMREAENGAAFLDKARDVCGCEVELTSGPREARLSALGILAGVHHADGIAGDLGGGSLELADIANGTISAAVTLPLGGLRLEDESGGALKKAEKIVEKALKPLDLSHGKGRAFYAIGGTWRAIARLHMIVTKYPLLVTHAYEVSAETMIEFCRFLQKDNDETRATIQQVSSERRPLIAYGALVLEDVLKATKSKSVIMSALGVREGLMFSQLSEAQQAQDPLISASRDLSLLHARSPQHGEDLCRWTDGLFDSFAVSEPEPMRRLRHAACLLADISWRAHPDYRGEQSVDFIAHGPFIGVDHPGRVFMALSVYHRHEGASETDMPVALMRLLDDDMRWRAAALGLSMRVAYLISATMPHVLDKTFLTVEKDVLRLVMPRHLADLCSPKLESRFQKLAKFLNLTPIFVIST